jgi:hypothetical protein
VTAASPQVADVTTGRPHDQGGPPLGVIAVVAAALFVCSLAIPIAVAGGAVYPSPYASDATIIAYFTGHAGAVRLSAVLQFAASGPLAIYAATASSRLNRLGVRAPGATIALSGGVLASASMALSGLLTWTLSRPEVAGHPESVRLVHDLAFAVGGPGTVVPLGLLLAGIAVPALILRLLPRWLAWAGLVVAGIAMIATLAVAFPAFAIAVPVARFPAMAWLIAAGFLLPRQRNRRHDDR